MTKQQRAKRHADTINRQYQRRYAGHVKRMYRVRDGSAAAAGEAVDGQTGEPIPPTKPRKLKVAVWARPKSQRRSLAEQADRLLRAAARNHNA